MLKGLFATGLLLCLSNAALAAVSAEEAAKLGSSLTPLGGDKAANAAGTITAWSGGITQAPAGDASTALLRASNSASSSRPSA